MEEIKDNKCKNCNGELEISSGNKGVLKCPYCGSVFTLPKSNDDEVLAALRMGEHDLDVCRFDDAYNAFKKAAELDPSEAEAYFGMALATAQVQYLKDYVNNCLQPIAHEVSNKTFAKDKNYLRALELATEEQSKEYQAKAKGIDDIRRKFYELKQSGLDYDCFLCVKVTDGKKHTEDSHIATTLYHELKNAGYVPFYSEEEIKNYTGSDYEAMILYALHTSESMLVICTDENYLQTPWVKNEYTRFIKMLRDDEKELDSITIVFKDEPIERLPGLDGKIQGIQFNRHDGLNRVISFVDKFAAKAAPEIARKEYGTTSYQKKQTLKQSINKRQLNSVAGGELSVSDKAQIATCNEFLMRRDFANAKVFAERQIAKNSSNSEAYWIAFLAQQRCAADTEFKTSTLPVSDYDYFEKAIAASQDSARKEVFYNALYERVAEQKRPEDYKEYIELPESSEEKIAALTDLMYRKALYEKNQTIFNLLINTVTDTDKYIAYNLEFAHSFSSESLRSEYYKNILKADEGHFEALWHVFDAECNAKSKDIFSVCADLNNAPLVEEKLFSYGFNVYATDKLYEMCLENIKNHTDKSCKVIDFILTMIPKNKNAQYLKYLNGFIEELLSAKKSAEVSKYNDLLISADQYNHSAYFNRCLIKYGLSNPLALLKYHETLYSDGDYISAMESYTEKFPNKKNMYVDINETFKEMRSLLKYPECFEYAVKNCYIPRSSLVGCKDKVYKFIADHGKNIYQEIAKQYKCKVFNDFYDLRVDVTGDARWEKVLLYCTAGESPNTKVIKQIVEMQGSYSRANVQKDQKDQRDRAVAKAKKNAVLAIKWIAFSSSAITVLSAILALFWVSPFYEVFLSLFDLSLNVMYGITIFFIILPCIALAVIMILFIVLDGWKKSKYVIICILVSVILSAVIFGTGINKIDNFENYYIGNGYCLELSETEDGDYKVVGCKDCGIVSTLTIPESHNGRKIVEICEDAFSGGGADPYNIIISDSVTKIDRNSYMIERGGYLESVTIGNGLRRIENEMFRDCHNLTNITIGIGVTSIGEYAFDGCTGLTDVYYKGSQMEWNAISIAKRNECLTNATIHFNS